MTPFDHRRWRRAFRLALRRPHAVEAEIDDEIRFHIAARVEALIARGYSRVDAEREALRRFGTFDEGRAGMLAAARRREERLTMLERLDAFGHDSRYALRQIRRAPGFSIAVVASFALGIGANATMFGIIDRLLLRPPAHIAEPERVFKLGEIRHFAGEQYRSTVFSFPAYADYRDHVGAFASVAASTGASDMALGRGEHARKIHGMLVSGNYFAVTGARPAAGRFFLPDEARLPDGVPVVVIGYGFWQREFDGEARAVGSVLDLGVRRYTIVGVAPKGFTGLQPMPVDVFVPIAAAEGLRFGGTNWSTSRGSYWLEVDARLKGGISPAQAEAQATAILAGAPLEAGQTRDPRARVYLESILHAGDPTEVRVSKLVTAVSVLVLLIACANVANLLVARSLRRRREIAVRLALGIGRARLVAQLLGESVLLAVLGGAAALVVVRWGGALVRAMWLENYAWDDSPVDARVAVFTASVALVTGLMAGLVPALQGSAPDLSRAFKEGAREGSPQSSRTRTLLLLVQAALAVVLLIGAGLFVRSLRNVNAVELGIDTDRVLVATMDLRSAGFREADIASLFTLMEERVRQLQGVASASVAGALPFRSSYAVELRVPGHDSLPQTADGGPYVNAVSRDFFATTGIRILRGRGFNRTDDATHARVMVVSESMARLVWKGDEPVGQCVVFDADSLPCTTVVGVAANTHRQRILEKDEVMQYYVRLEHAPASMQDRILFVRPKNGEPATWTEPVRRVLQTAAPNLPYADVRPMRTLLGGELRPQRLGASMFGVFGALALVLTALGLYSVIAYSVAQRTHEMGVRIALGAQRTNILSLIVRQGVGVALAGTAIGIGTALAAGRLVEPLLYQVSPHDPLILLLVAGVLLVVAATASLVPAHRATEVDPATALRAE